MSIYTPGAGKNMYVDFKEATIVIIERECVKKRPDDFYRQHQRVKKRHYGHVYISFYIDR